MDFYRKYISAEMGAAALNFYTRYNPLNCISSRTCGAGPPQIGLCPIFLVYYNKKSKVLSRALRPMGRRWSPFHSPQPDTSLSCKTKDTGLVYHMVCPLTPRFSLVLINRPRRDGTLSWHWYTATVGGIRTRDLAIASPAPYHSATGYRNYNTDD